MKLQIGDRVFKCGKFDGLGKTGTYVGDITNRGLLWVKWDNGHPSHAELEYWQEYLTIIEQDWDK